LLTLPPMAAPTADPRSSKPQDNRLRGPAVLPSTVKDGRIQITRSGARQSSWSDLYHALMAASWGKLFLIIGFAYLFINVVFAFAYLAGGDCIAEARPGSFRDTFFFGVQTMATIGYGRMYPKTTYADIFVTSEALCGLLSVSMATGLMFSKFARPTARLIFSKVAVISDRNGVPCLMFRMANERSNTIIEAQVRVVVSIGDRTIDGERERRILDLNLVRDNSLLFTLTWTVIHPITGESPLYRVLEGGLAGSDATFIITVTGIDDTFAQTVHARHAYSAKDVVVGACFADVLAPRPEGGANVDYSVFHDTMPSPVTLPPALKA